MRVDSDNIPESQNEAAISHDINDVEVRSFEEALKLAILIWDDVTYFAVACRAIKGLLWLHFFVWVYFAYQMIASRGLLFILSYFFVMASIAFVAVQARLCFSRDFLGSLSRSLASHKAADIDPSSLAIRCKEIQAQSSIDYLFACVCACGLIIFTATVCRVSDPDTACVLSSIFFYFRCRACYRTEVDLVDFRMWGGYVSETTGPLISIAAIRVTGGDLLVSIATTVLTYGMVLIAVLLFNQRGIDVAAKIEKAKWIRV